MHQRISNALCGLFLTPALITVSTIAAAAGELPNYAVERWCDQVANFQWIEV
jgi:hypothetical protein